jgi:prevent-host-death family protein
MGVYTIVEAKDQFSKVIEEVRSGVAATITWHGEPVATIMPVRATPRKFTPADYDEIERRRNARAPSEIDSVASVREMRDETT